MSGFLLVIWTVVEVFGPEDEDDDEEEESQTKNGSTKAVVDAHHHEHQEKLHEFYAFRRRYFLVYCVIMLADWMQGTHVSSDKPT